MYEGLEMTTWRKEMKKVAKNDKLTDWTLSEEEWDREFYSDLGVPEGTDFTAWSKDWVYFPAESDGYEWIERVPRNPCSIRTKHVGGSHERPI